MNIYDVLHKDHKKAIVTLNKLAQEAAVGDEDARETFQDLKSELEEHINAEERHFYPRVRRQAGSAELIDQAVEQHRDIVRRLASMLALVDADSDQFRDELEGLRMSLERHINLEESEIFTMARLAFTDREERVISREVLADEPTAHPIRSRLAGWVEEARL